MLVPPPAYLQVEITSRCNLKCRMCPLTLGTTASSGSDGHISELDWDQVKRLGRLCGRVAILGFGEPAMHPKFVSMLQELDDLGIETSFSTNGIGGEAIARHLSSLKRLRCVNISIDSPDPQIYEEIRGGDLGRALKGMRAIAALAPPHVTVTVSSVAMKSNIHSLVDFPAMLKDAGISVYAVTALQDYTHELESEHIHAGRGLQMFFPWRRLHKTLDELKDACAEHGIHLNLSHRTQLDFYKPEEAAVEYFAPGGELTQTRACTAPFDSMYVDADGRVYPCCTAAGSEPLGSLRTSNLEEIWSGEGFGRFRRDILRAETTPEPCRTCTMAPLGEHPVHIFAGAIEAMERIDESGRFQMLVRNQGKRSWDRQALLCLGTSSPRDRESAHWHPSWMSRNRIASMIETEVQPGEMATLEFQMTPAEVRSPEMFQLVIEGHTWLWDCALEIEAVPLATRAAR